MRPNKTSLVALVMLAGSCNAVLGIEDWTPKPAAAGATAGSGGAGAGAGPSGGTSGSGPSAGTAGSSGSGLGGSGGTNPGDGGDAGQAGADMCPEAYVQCGAGDDPCGTNTLTDPDHCGDCNEGCSSNHVPTPSCSAGDCSGACETGYDDCNDDKKTDGCETGTDDDPDHCGTCDSDCSSNNMQTRTCASGTCNGTCSSGFMDCDLDKLENGCETDVLSTNSKCGSCTNSCDPLKYCVSGSCTTCTKTALFLGDTVTAANADLVTYLQATGLTVTASTIAAYAGSPAASSFNVVVIPVGRSTGYIGDDPTLPAAGQSSIVSAQAAGTGLLLTESASTAAYQAWSTELAGLTLMRAGQYACCYTGPYEVTSGWHPIWNDLPSMFNATVGIQIGQFGSDGAVINGGTVVATISGEPMVIVKDSGGGRIVQIEHTANVEPTWYSDPNLLRMFTNAALWAAKCL